MEIRVEEELVELRLVELASSSKKENQVNQLRDLKPSPFKTRQFLDQGTSFVFLFLSKDKGV